MKITSKAVLALLFIPGAFSSSLHASTTEEQAEEDASANREDSRRLDDWKGSGCKRKLKATMRNPLDPEDCDENVCGTVVFACPDTWRKSGLTEVTYSMTGLTPGLHALHVHEFPVGKGDENTCGSTGGHWNPKKNDHGGNLDAQRHIGDLGNILADGDGVAEGVLLARVPLRGRLGIRNRAVVVHAGTDDLGLGGDTGSRAVGNAGARPGCGTIKYM